MKESSSHATSKVIITVCVAVVLAFWASLGDSLIVDEIPHIGAGYSYVRTGDMRLNPEHPPLVKDIAGLPLLLLGLNEDAFAQPQWTTEVNGQWTFGRKLIFNSGNNAEHIKNLARLPMLGLLILGAYFVWRWSRERYGDTAGVIAVTLFVLSPTILAHTRFVTTDMAAAVGILASTYYFLHLLRQPTRRSFVLASLTLGLALLAKFNTVLLAPYFLIIAVLYGFAGNFFGQRAWHRVIRNIGITALVGIAAFVGVVWPVYILHTFNYPPERQLTDTQTTLGWQDDSILKTMVLWAADKPVIRAAGQWGLGLAMVQQRSAGGNTIYWLGQVVKQGGPWYFPLVYFIKEPIAWWILVATALTTFCYWPRRFSRGADRQASAWTQHTEEWVWLLWLAIYWAISIRSTLNIGIRHLLPIYPFTIMLVAGRLSMVLDWLKKHDHSRWRKVSLGIAVLLGFYTFESVRVFPYYLTYFNQIAGGPSGGHRYVVDSNLDWGQDAKRLGEFVKENNIKKISVDYFGWTDAVYYLGDAHVWTSSTQWRDAQDFIKRNTTNGWIAVSGTFLQNSNGEKTFEDNSDKGTYRWLLNYEPVIVVGNSIFVYHLK